MSNQNPHFTIEHIGLPARNPETLKDWYLTTLEGELVWENGQHPPAFYLRVGGWILEIYKADGGSLETSNNSVAGYRHLALRVESLEAAVALLEERGVLFTQPTKPAGGGGRVRFFQDLEGNLLHLVERGSDSPLLAALGG